MSKYKSRTADGKAQRANPPGRYACPHCGERLSGPAREYVCPQRLPPVQLEKAA
jgi:hypothetical protein